MRNLVFALIIGLVLVGAASASAPPVKCSWYSVASLGLEGQVDAKAKAHWDSVYTSTFQVLLPIGKADGFEVNSKDDPFVAGEYASGALAIAADEVIDGKDALEFKGIEGYASAATDVKIAVNGYDTALADINADTNAFTSVENKWGNIANSGSNLDIWAKATGMPAEKN